MSEATTLLTAPQNFCFLIDQTFSRTALNLMTPHKSSSAQTQEHKILKILQLKIFQNLRKKLFCLTAFRFLSIKRFKSIFNASHHSLDADAPENGPKASKRLHLGRTNFSPNARSRKKTPNNQIFRVKKRKQSCLQCFWLHGADLVNKELKSIPFVARHLCNTSCKMCVSFNKHS